MISGRTMIAVDIADSGMAWIDERAQRRGIQREDMIRIMLASACKTIENEERLARIRAHRAKDAAEKPGGRVTAAK